MYELQNINPDITNKFWKLIYKTMQHPNWDKVILLVIKNTFYSMIPNTQQHWLEPYIKRYVQEFSNIKNSNFQIRDFQDEKEQEEVYHLTYDSLINELENSTKSEDVHNLELIDFIYELLPYDKVIMIDDEKYLYSFFYLSLYGEEHLYAYEDLKVLYKNKPAEKNYDIATNTTKNFKSKTAFLNDTLQLEIKHPFVNSEKVEIQYKVVQEFETQSHLTIRTVYEFSKIKDESNIKEISAIGELQPYLNSDDKIEYKDIYISWYAYVFSIYKRFGIEIPTTKLLKLAQLSSKVLFEPLREIDKPLINQKTATKALREVAFFNGLRLMDFSDMRKKIKKTDDEIKFMEEFMNHLINNLSKHL